MENFSLVLYIIIGLFLALWSISKMEAEKEEINKKVLIVKYALFTLLCSTELYYFLYQENGLWFCNYKQIGWLKAMLGFIILCIFLLKQTRIFIILLYKLHTAKKPANFTIGFYSYGVFFVLGIISVWLSMQYWSYIFYFFLTCQFLQLIVIFYTNYPYWKSALASVFLYLLGTITLAVALFYFAIPIICAFLVLLIIWILSLFYPVISHFYSQM